MDGFLRHNIETERNELLVRKKRYEILKIVTMRLFYLVR